jgi:1-acyl-sn-glycerol-3-phosphate acyltransferase
MSRLRALLRLVRVVHVLVGTRVSFGIASLQPDASVTRRTRRARRAATRLAQVLGLELHVSGFAPTEPALLVANHRSYTDILALLACIECTFLAKVEMSRWPLFGSLARRLGTVFVDRDCKESRRAARRRLAELLEEGRRVAVFPEGTTTRGPGCLPFQPGMFYAAAERGIPVVPVSLHYEHTEDAWVGDDTLLRHFFDRFARPAMRLHVRFGPALSHDDGAALRRAAEAWIAESVERTARAVRGWEAAQRQGGRDGRPHFVPRGAPVPAGADPSGG